MSTDKPTDDVASGAQAAAEARAAEIREEVAITDARRAEEDEAKAQAEREAAQRKEAEKERALAAAEERRQAAIAESERARRDATAAAGAPPTPTPLQGIADAPAAPPDDLKAKAEDIAGRPEVQIGAAFAGTFVLAQIVKRLGS